MPQLHLPMFPNGVIHITDQLAVMKKDDAVTYFNGHMPVFSHGENDINTFRMITSQFCFNGAAKQSDIIRAFGVTSISVKRSVKTYREKGPKGFYALRVRRGAAVLVDPVVAAAEELLADGVGDADVAEKLGLKLNTLQKAIRAGRVRRPVKKNLTTPSSRARKPSTPPRIVRRLKAERRRRRPAPKASGPKRTVPPPWGAVRPPSWTGWRPASDFSAR